MRISLCGVRLTMLAAILCVSGCVLKTDDDKDDDGLVTDESAVVDTGGGVSVSVDVMRCRTTCEDSYKQCGTRCVNDQPCVSGCETKKGECYTSCD
jgi:hypothetical protein